MDKRGAAGCRIKVLDMHCHTAGFGYGDSGCFLSPGLHRSWKTTLFLKAFGITRNDLLQYGDRFVFNRIAKLLEESQTVDEAVILAMDGVIDKYSGQLDRTATRFYIPGSFVVRETARFTRLHYGASINPYRFGAIEDVQEAAAKGAVLIKWIPSIMNINPSDQALKPFYRELVRCNLPLLTHTGHERIFRHADNRLGDPWLLELPLKTGVTVIAAHLAATGKSNGVDNTERLLSMMPLYPNLYADISSLTQINKIRFFNRIFAEPAIQNRLLYGTDFPLINTPLCHPLFSICKIGVTQARKLIKMRNPWDKDFLLKTAWGIRPEVFSRSWEMLIGSRQPPPAADQRVFYR